MKGTPPLGIGLTTSQVELQNATRHFVQAEVVPRAGEMDSQNAWLSPLWDGIKALGVTGVAFDAELGGGGGSYLDFILMTEELARGSAAAALMPAVNVIVARALEMYGSESAKARYLPGLLNGSLKACWAFTEPATGSDPRAIESRAAPGEDGWIVSGRKAFISHSSVCDLAVVFAQIDGRLGAVVVEANQEGFQPGPRYDLLGLRGADTGDLVLADCHAPADNLLGEPDDGMNVLVSVEAEAKIRASAMCVGMAQSALDEALAYGIQREHRGVSIAEKFPTIQSLLANISVETEIARWVTYRAATIRDGGDRDEIVRMAAVAKLAASRSSKEAASLAMQVHGAYGYVNESPITRIYRDAKAYEMIQGTAEIQRVIVARSLLEGVRGYE